MIEEKAVTRVSEEQANSRLVLGHLVNGTVVHFNESTLDVFNPAHGTVIKQLSVGGKSAVEELYPPQKKRYLNGKKLQLSNEHE